MAYAVITCFDPATEANVRALWNLIAQLGISSTMRMMNIRPHISLIGFEAPCPSALRAEMASVATGIEPLSIQLSAVGVFPTAQGVVYLAPVVTRELIDLHGQLHAQLTRLGIVPHEYYVPGNWVPHCTAAINLPPESVPLAVDVCRQSNVFRPAQLDAIALVEYMPVREIYTFPFGGKSDVEPHRDSAPHHAD